MTDGEIIRLVNKYFKPISYGFMEQDTFNAINFDRFEDHDGTMRVFTKIPSGVNKKYNYYFSRNGSFDLMNPDGNIMELVYKEQMENIINE